MPIVQTNKSINEPVPGIAVGGRCFDKTTTTKSEVFNVVMFTVKSTEAVLVDEDLLTVLSW